VRLTNLLPAERGLTRDRGGPRGFHAGKKVNGRKRHLVTNTLGLPLALALCWPSILPASTIATA
jgi:hypothetical protein